MRNELRGAAIVITGASSGIGRVTARRFAEKGASLVLVARRAGMLEEAADECRARGVDAVAVPGDVAEPASDPAIVADAIVSLAERPRREVVVGAVGKAMIFQHRFLPDVAERLMSWSTKRSVFRREPAAPDPGTLHHAISDGLDARGGWRTGSGNSGLLAAGALALLPLAIMIWSSRRRA